MSEAASSGSSGSSSGGSSAGSGAGTSPGSPSSAGTSAGGGAGQSSSAGTRGTGGGGTSAGSNSGAQASGAGSQSGGGSSTDAGAADAFEEVKVGSATIKVQKDVARTIREMQKGMYSSQQRAAAIEKQARGLIKLAADNPREFYKTIGKQSPEVRALFEKTLAEEYEVEALSPEQKRLRDYEAKIKEYEDRDKITTETKQREEYEKTYTTEAQTIRDSFMNAWKESGLPADERFGAWVMMEVQKSIAIGEVPENTPTDRLPWKEAAAKVKSAWIGHARDYAASLPPQALEELLGPKTLKAWRDFDVNRVTASAATRNQSATDIRPGSSPASANKKSGLSEDEYRDYIERIKQGQS